MIPSMQLTLFILSAYLFTLCTLPISKTWLRHCLHFTESTSCWTKGPSSVKNLHNDWRYTYSQHKNV